MKTEYYFEQLGRETQSLTPTGPAILSGSVKAWRCGCYWMNGETVERCNSCGEPRVESFPVEHPQLKSLSEANKENA